MATSRGMRLMTSCRGAHWLLLAREQRILLAERSLGGLKVGRRCFIITVFSTSVHDSYSLVLLPGPPKRWVFRHVPSHPYFVVLGY